MRESNDWPCRTGAPPAVAGWPPASGALALQKPKKAFSGFGCPSAPCKCPPDVKGWPSAPVQKPTRRLHATSCTVPLPARRLRPRCCSRAFILPQTKNALLHRAAMPRETAGGLLPGADAHPKASPALPHRARDAPHTPTGLKFDFHEPAPRLHRRIAASLCAALSTQHGWSAMILVAGYSLGERGPL